MYVCGFCFLFKVLFWFFEPLIKWVSELLWCTSWHWSEWSLAADVSRVSLYFGKPSSVIWFCLPSLQLRTQNWRITQVGLWPLSWTSPGITASQGLLSVMTPVSLQVELLPSWSLPRVSVFQVSAYQMKDFAFMLPSCKPPAGHALKSTPSLVWLADFMWVSSVFFPCRLLLRILNVRGPWRDLWEGLLASAPQVVWGALVSDLF